MTPILLLLLTIAGLLVLLAWYFRPILASITGDLQSTPPRRRELPPGLASADCGIGATLMAAAASTGTAAPPEQAEGATPVADEPTDEEPAAKAAAPKPAVKAEPAKKPKRKKPTGPDRRAFLRNGLFVTMGGVLAAFGAASIGFLWPRLGSGAFGAEIDLGSEADLLDQIAEGNGRFEYPAGRMYLVAYDAAKDDDDQYADITGGASVMALYQKCVHLGCRVPWCDSSRWFECPCHGSRYNRWGEYEFGPAPRGLDRFPIELRDGEVFVNTAEIVTGPSRTGGVLGEPAAGPKCSG